MKPSSGSALQTKEAMTGAGQDVVDDDEAMPAAEQEAEDDETMTAAEQEEGVWKDVTLVASAPKASPSSTPGDKEALLAHAIGFLVSLSLYICLIYIYIYTHVYILYMYTVSWFG